MRIVGLCFVFSGLLVSHAVDACTCAQPGLHQTQAVTMAFKHADVVFLGRVEDVSVVIPHDAYSVRLEETTFYVQKSWKGERASRIITRIDVQRGSCGYAFEVGETYLVYGSYLDDGFVGASSCTRTTLENHAGPDIEILERLIDRNRKPTAGPAVQSFATVSATTSRSPRASARSSVR